MPKGKKIPIKQKLFVKEYIIDFNGTNAYLKVYKCGYDTARNNAAKLLAKDCIQQILQKEIEKLSKRIDITQEQVIKDIIFDRGIARSLKQMSVAMKGNELLGRSLAMFIDRVEQFNKYDPKGQDVNIKLKDQEHLAEQLGILFSGKKPRKEKLEKKKKKGDNK